MSLLFEGPARLTRAIFRRYAILSPPAPMEFEIVINDD